MRIPVPKYNVLSTEDFFDVVLYYTMVHLHSSDNIAYIIMVDYNSTVIITEILKCGYYRYRYVVVQFYPWFKFSFLLFQTLYCNHYYHTLPYPKTNKHKV